MQISLEIAANRTWASLNQALSFDMQATRCVTALHTASRLRHPHNSRDARASVWAQTNYFRISK
jgi:hypothetical protein